MAIRVEHGTVAPVAQLALAAGRAETAKRKEMLAFQAMLSAEASQRAQLWELEKMEMRSRNDFALLERRREISEMDDIFEEQRKKRELQAKLEAIDKSEILSDREKADMRLQVMTGIRPPKKLTPKQRFDEMMYGPLLGAEGLEGIGEIEGIAEVPEPSPPAEPVSIGSPKIGEVRTVRGVTREYIGEGRWRLKSTPRTLTPTRTPTEPLSWPLLKM